MSEFRTGLRRVLADDALLRLYCAPAPQNWLALGELARSDFPGDVLALKRLVADQPPDWRARDHLAEFVVRPLLITFRGLLARGFLPVGEVGVELGAESSATGRIVVEGIRPATGAEVPVAITALDGQLDELAVAAVLVTGDERDRIRGAFDEVVAQELRNLSVETAAALAGDHPWRKFLHVVEAGQHDVLRQVLRAVRERSARCRRERGLPRPLVAVDLDFCAVHPEQRVREALRRVGGIAEFADPDRLAVLPGLYRSGWPSFLARNGLRERYPEFDWDELYTEFRRNIAWDGEALRTDVLAPGIKRYVRDLEQAGARVVWLTGRRNRVRAATEEFLTGCGLGHLDLRTSDDDPARSIAEQKVAALREFREHELVAAFDDSATNRAALRSAFPSALVVPVRAPLFTSDDADGIATFESLPHPVPLGRGHAREAQLSHATSVSALRVGELSTRPTIWDRGAELTAADQARIVDALVATAVTSGRKLGGEVAAGTDPVRAVWQVITAKPFGASRSAYPLAAAERDLRAPVEAGEPIRFVVVGPSLKQDGSRLKALGGLPDLAELAMLVRLRQLDAAVRQVHPPGVRVRALTDASHFRFREPHRCAAYHQEFARQVAAVGAEDLVVVEDFDDAADAHPACGDRTQRPDLLRAHRERYETAFAGLDIRRNPRAVLAEAATRDPSAPGQPRFAELFRSVLHAVDVPCRGGDPLAWSQRIYADPFDLTDRDVPPEVRGARGELLVSAWHETITYLANKHVDADLGYEVLWQDDVRMSLSIRPAPGRLRFVPLGGSGVMPWHGTAALTANQEVAVDYAISLVDQGFRPLYAPGTPPRRGLRQPWLMAPPHLLDGSGRPTEALLSGIRLRAK
ncbi:L-tyrosine/L-tryptophan isonitrile synthase family protein [Saccharopolyspora hirsuta]|uniref:L-tyrosine/L-tryptophan isonitrile synthase family protein n=1 Tax=Saccharopolyspora hirsuta TaxID=1837 RepID=A0A5M7C172_SACHI|nr:HAD family hydrolase [Saccharopolyspora hirsuta]KAA5836186.1 L-tyrosine/L-tryptophan isonitrile synthase family protein [Saccharopolyspora hirsuta]